MAGTHKHNDSGFKQSDNAKSAAFLVVLATYLKLTGCPVGLLMNFNVPVLTNGGVRRLVHPSQEQ